MPNFFGKGCLLKHRNLGLIAHIREVDEEGRLHLSWAEPSEDPMDRYLLSSSSWSVVEALREFTPILSTANHAESRIDLLLADEFAPDASEE